MEGDHIDFLLCRRGYEFFNVGINLEKENMNSICKKASNKLHALSRQCAILRFHRRKMLMQVFFNSQLSYCPLVWMFHTKTLNNRINKNHDRFMDSLSR